MHRGIAASRMPIVGCAINPGAFQCSVLPSIEIHHGRHCSVPGFRTSRRFAFVLLPDLERKLGHARGHDPFAPKG